MPARTTAAAASTMVEASSGDRIASLLHRARGSVHTRRMARLPKKQEVVRGLLDNLNEALVILDPALEVVEWNASMERLTGVISPVASGLCTSALSHLIRSS